MTGKQKRFAEEYVVDLHGTNAAIRAGYSEKSAAESASENLRNSKVSDYIAELQADVIDDATSRAERIVNELSLIAFSDVGEVLDFNGDTARIKPANQIGKHARKAIQSVKVKRYTEGHGDDAREVEVQEFRLWDKVAALEKLGKHLGMMPDRLEVTGRDGKPIEVVDPTTNERRTAEALAILDAARARAIQSAPVPPADEVLPPPTVPETTPLPGDGLP